MLTGWKTVIFGLLMAVGPATLNYIGAINWTSLGVSPLAGTIIGAIIIGLRAMTSTAIGTAPPSGSA